MLEMPDEWWESVHVVNVRPYYPTHAYSFALTSPRPWFTDGTSYFLYLDGHTLRPCWLPRDPALLVPDKYLFKIQQEIAAGSPDTT